MGVDDPSMVPALSPLSDMPPPQRAWTIGTNTLQLEPPDIVWAEFRGGCTLSEAARIVDLCRELGSTHPFYLVGDMEQASGMDPEVRHYFTDHLQHEWILGVIYFKTRLLHRAIVKGLILAAEMTRAESSPMWERIHFVPTQAKARALLAQLRAGPRRP